MLWAPVQPQPPAKGLQFIALPSCPQVLEVPPGATLLASSERCPVEMYAVGDHVLCIQVRRRVYEKQCCAVQAAVADMWRRTLLGTSCCASRGVRHPQL